MKYIFSAQKDSPRSWLESNLLAAASQGAGAPLSLSSVLAQGGTQADRGSARVDAMKSGVEKD